jgi:hypothetical protein
MGRIRQGALNDFADVLYRYRSLKQSQVQQMLHSKYHESRMSYIQKAEHWKYTKHTTRIREDEGLEHSL